MAEPGYDEKSINGYKGIDRLPLGRMRDCVKETIIGKLHWNLGLSRTQYVVMDENRF